jgi:hypothetical protein
MKTSFSHPPPIKGKTRTFSKVGGGNSKIFLQISLNIFETFYALPYSFWCPHSNTKLHNEELHNSYYSPSIIRMLKSKRMEWAGYVARMRRRGTHIGYWWEIPKERDH